MEHSSRRHRWAWALLVAAGVVGPIALACERQPVPARELAPLPLPLPSPVAKEQMDAMVAIASVGPISAARMIELPAPSVERPVCIGQADPYALNAWPVVVDRRGDVFAADDFGGQIVVQPAGSLENARALAAVPRINPWGDEQLGWLAVDDSTVFFTSNLRNFDASESAWAVRAVPKAGGAAVVLARGDAPGGFTSSLALDDASVYFLHDVPQGTRSDGTLWRVDKRGGEPVPVVRGLGAHFAWCLAGDEIFYHSPEHAEIRKLATAGGEPTTVVSTSIAPGRILVAGGSLYFTTATLSAEPAARITLYGSDLETPSAQAIASYDGWLSSVRHDGESVYWAEFTEDSIDAPQRVMARTGSAPPHVAYEPIGHSEAWEIHDGKVYWGTTRCVRSAELLR